MRLPMSCLPEQTPHLGSSIIMCIRNQKHNATPQNHPTNNHKRQLRLPPTLYKRSLPTIFLHRTNIICQPIPKAHQT